MQHSNRCVIKGCKKNGLYRLIHSDDPYYGWFCGNHQSELHSKNYIYLEGEGYDLTIPHEHNDHTVCVSCGLGKPGRGKPCGICEYIQNKQQHKWIYEMGNKHSNLIRTVIFPTGKEKGKEAKEDLAKELDLFLHNNKISRDQIITIQYEIGGGGGSAGSIFLNIMLVYEIPRESGC
jgi:hypothetical protein